MLEIEQAGGVSRGVAEGDTGRYSYGADTGVELHGRTSKVIHEMSMTWVEGSCAETEDGAVETQLGFDGWTEGDDELVRRLDVPLIVFPTSSLQRPTAQLTITMIINSLSYML